MPDQPKNPLAEIRKTTKIYEERQLVTDVTTGEILSDTRSTVKKVANEPDFIKVYYQTMMAFNNIFEIPVSFLLSLSKFIEYSNEGGEIYVTLNNRVKETLCQDCNLSIAQINRHIKNCRDKGLLFKSQWRAVYIVNPLMIAKGRWESIRQLQATYDCIEGKWVRNIKQVPGTPGIIEQPTEAEPLPETAKSPKEARKPKQAKNTTPKKKTTPKGA